MSGDIATDFIAHRRQLKGALTPTAWAGIQREVTKADMDLDSAATLMMARGWRGFMASWVKPEDRAMTTRSADQAFISRLRHSGTNDDPHPSHRADLPQDGFQGKPPSTPAETLPAEGVGASSGKCHDPHQSITLIRA